MEFEVCIDSVEGAIKAGEFGAKRVELCAALGDGGITPSIGMIEACVKATDAEVFVMIRPSAGGFNYSDHELTLMERDIRAAHEVGAHGVVFGVLNESLEVAIKKNVFLMETALKLELGTTFHRAIDVTKDPIDAMENIINMGFDRILTSGGQATAEEGIQLIEKLQQKGQNQIEIMAGSGINAFNVQQFRTIGISAVHFTANTIVKDDFDLDMGPKHAVNVEKIRAISDSLTS